MSDPDVVATREFCERGGRAEGRFDPAVTERFRDVAVAGSAGAAAVEWRVTGRIGRDSRMQIVIEAHGELVTTCQRCLGPLVHRVAAARTIVFMPPGALGSVEDEADDEDQVPFEPTLRPADWAVEEVLLSLPYAPVHADPECTAHDGASDKVSAQQH